MMMTDNNWTKFKVIGDFNTDIRSLYQAWATAAGLEKWFLRKADLSAATARNPTMNAPMPAERMAAAPEPFGRTAEIAGIEGSCFFIVILRA